MPVLVEQASKTTNPAIARVEKLAGAGLVSASLSVLIAAIFRNSIGRMTSHIVFIVAVAVIGLVLFWSGKAVDHFDAGLVVMLFLFEPLGRVLMHLETIPANALLAVPLVVVAAYFFGRDNYAHRNEETE